MPMRLVGYICNYLMRSIMFKGRVLKSRFSLRAETGFSLPELMVVVVIISLLAGLSLPRLRAFIAKGRQAEARTNLAHIHTLQVGYQDLNDTFARWNKTPTTTVGKKGVCEGNINKSTAGTCSNTAHNNDKTACDNASGTWTPLGPGAFELGFKPLNCKNLRYGYWILQGVNADNGRERFLAIAYAPSDTTHRIYPTCTGKASGRGEISHPDVAKVANLKTGAIADGDWQTVTEDKVFGISDIIPICEDL